MVATPDVPAVIGPLDPPLLHVMTCNLRCQVPSTVPGQPDHWPTRREVHRSILLTEKPSLIGFQEVLAGQLDDLRAMLGTHYLLLGEGRDGGTAGEYNPIAVDLTRFEVLDHQQFWLSQTPDVPGSVSWGSSLPRIAVVARLRDRATGRELGFVNTHLDHMSEAARGGGAQLIRDRLADVPGPVVVVGDMNTPRPEGAAWQAFTGAPQADAFVEAWTVAERRLGEDVETFHAYASEPTGEGRIDWILVRGDVRVEAVGTNTTTVDGAFASDHWPVQAVIELG